jgi:indole-3-acetate monooxygenase
MNAVSLQKRPSEQIVRPPADPVATLLQAVASRHEEFGNQRRLSPDIVELLKAAGVYRALVARQFGGDEKSPADFLRLIERISVADGSTGWVASFGFSAVYLSALPLGTLATMYANGPDVVFAGGIFPPQTARSVDGGYQVSGRWTWGSGCTGANVIGVGIKVEDGVRTNGLPLIAVMPSSKVTIAENWDVNGLKGTGSHDMIVDKVVVAPEWTFVRGGPSSLDAPLYRYPSMALAAQVLAVVALGVARAALDHMKAIASNRVSITGAPTFGDRAHVQIEIAKAEARVRSARAFFYEATDVAFDKLVAGDDLSLEDRAMIRLASSHAARTGADVAAAIYRLSGTDGIFTANPVARFMQDAMIVPQHAFLSEGTWQSAGRILLGFEPAPGFP